MSLGSPTPLRRIAPPSRLLVVALAVGLMLIGAGIALIANESDPQAGAGEVRQVSEASLSAQPVDILRAWDRRRARAYAKGDLRALDALYTPGSRAGALDHRIMRRYLARGLRVEGMRTQLLRAQVKAHDGKTLTVVLTDRLLPARAVGNDVDIPLPAGLPRTREIRLRASEAGWRVVEATLQS